MSAANRAASSRLAPCKPGSGRRKDRHPKMPQALTADRLRTVLDYDPLTGVFRWKMDRRAAAKTGDIAGFLHDTRGDGSCAYWFVKVDGRMYRAHRLAWLYMTGEWPKVHIDHRNLVKSDNRWDNLREATPLQNQWNTGVNKSNTSGFKGVHWEGGRNNRWRATMQVHGKQRHLGYFDTAEQAGEAYRIAAEHLHGEFVHQV